LKSADGVAIGRRTLPRESTEPGLNQQRFCGTEATLFWTNLRLRAMTKRARTLRAARPLAAIRSDSCAGTTKISFHPTRTAQTDAGAHPARGGYFVMISAFE
jgi:hypothetical protein